MKKYTKAGLLIVTLVIPALIFILLRLFGTNHYRVAFFHPLTDGQGNIIVSGVDTSFYQVDCQFKGEPNSAILGSGSLQGHLTVLSYLSEPCDDTCRSMFRQLDRIYAMRADVTGLNLITIGGMKPAKLTTLSAGIGNLGWSYVGFPAPLLDSVLYGCLRLQAGARDEQNVSAHKLVLVDDNGHIRGYYGGGSEEEIERLMAEIKILKYEKDNYK